MIRIEQLRIDAGELRPEDGERLAELVAAALGGAPLPRHGDATALRVTVAAGDVQPLARTAEDIAAAIARALANGRSPGGAAG